MLYNLLAGSTGSEYRSVEWTEAALYALLGFLVVFVGIIFLIFIVWAIGKIMGKGQKQSVSKVQTPPKNIEKTTENIDEGVYEETVAVIMAALMAYYQTNNPKCDFTVKRIKRI